MARRSRLCLAGLAAFLVVYFLVMMLAVIGTSGMFGLEPNPLSAVWLIFLGVPWTLLFGLLPGDNIPEFIGRLVIGLAPMLNLWLLSLFCRRRHRRW